ncbi:protein lin-28 homolog A-like [Columba livia]|uniref:protein lin-28 homolog A-like n=1 Tax=Columba livia TaxID=8932 RepID=UPI0031BABE63
MAAVFDQQSAGEELARALPTLYGSGTCKWFNTRLGFGFLTVTTVGGKTLDSPIEVFVHQSKSHTKGFRSPEDGEDVQFTLLESPKGLERIWVTGPGGAYCIGKKKPQRKDKCYNCGERGRHAKECKLPPQPKRCHFCRSTSHMVTSCPKKAQQYSELPPRV